MVGGYIFLAGLSGGAAIVSTLAEAVRGERAQGVGRRGRYVATLAPTLGAAAADLGPAHASALLQHVADRQGQRSPMSIGTWILTAFIPSSMLGAGAQVLADVLPGAGWLKPVARWGSAPPSAITGAGLSVYTASLLAATSTPYWAAAPRSLAVRFGASSIASGSASLVIGERDEATRDALNLILGGALAVELAATVAHHHEVKKPGAWARC